MIKWIASAAAVVAGAAFAAGAYVGWKTTLKAMDSVAKRTKDPGDGRE
jgi:hypothetical protein